ncbi:MAG: ABC transporter ATP-binding protein [Bacteroidota bacterium]
MQAVKGRGELVFPQLKPFQFCYRLSKCYWQYALPALLVVILAETAGVSLSYVMKELVDALATSGANPMYWAYVYAGLYAVSELGWRSSGYLGMLWITKTRALAASSLFGWLSKHSSSYFADRFAGSLATKVTNASNGVSDILPKVLWNFFPTFLQLFLSIGFAYAAKPLLAGILGIWCVIFLILNTLLVQKKAKLAEASSDAYTKLKGQFVDIISNIRAVHQFAHLGREKKRAKRFIEDHRQKSLRSWRYSEHILVTNNVLQSILLAGILVSSIYLHQQELLTIGEVVMVINLTWGILESLFFIGSSLNGMMESYGTVKEGLDIILHPHEIVDAPEASELAATRGSIYVQGMTFSYGGRRSVFEEFTLEIPAGQKVGLVGESGAGKSTLTQLLLRMYDVEAGGIYIDGQNISQVSQESLRKAISFVPQSSMLFHRSLKENIRYGDVEATDEMVAQAAQYAGAHKFIVDLPEGYETLVGERGVKLSGGQAQRISIARAMLKIQAPILVLDEATSALDSESELIVQQALEKLIQNRTVIAIAHRLSTLLAMDRILVLDQGKIAEDGSHVELLQKGGIYAKLWAHQAGGFLNGNKADRLQPNPVKQE